MEIKILKFGEGLLVPVLSRKEELTLRLYRPEAHDFEEDEYFIGRFADGGLDIVLRATAKTEKTTFRHLTDEVAQKDTYANAQEAYKDMGTYYKDLTPDSPCAIIRFDIPQITGLPSIRLTPREK